MKTAVRTLLAIVASLGILASTGRADISQEKRAEIRKMIELTGMTHLVDQMMNQMMEDLRADKSLKVSEEFLAKLRQRMQAEDLIEMMLPLYDKYMTLEDLKAINVFYVSPVGKKLQAVTPQMMQEVSAVSEKWGKQIGREVIDEMAKERAKKPATDTKTS